MTHTVLAVPHIPKTGGQTLSNHGRKHLTIHESFINMDRLSIEEAKTMGLGNWEDRPLEKRQEAKFIMGHRLYLPILEKALPDSNITFATCLRDPAERWVSDYNFNRTFGNVAPETDFWDFLDTHSHKSSQCLFLWLQFLQIPIEHRDVMLAGAIELLETFAYVGIMPKFAEYSQFVTEQLKLPPIKDKQNVSGQHHKKYLEVTDEIRERMEEEAPHDYALYRHFENKHATPTATNQTEAV